MLIKELEHQIRVPFEEGGKRTFFLVPSVPLAVQQKDAIQRHTSLRIGSYIGAMGIDNWDKDHWQKEFSDKHVLVMTADIFKIIITHGFLPFARVNLIVVDECHKAVKKHTYREIFRCLDVVDPEDHPKVLGLTASVISDQTKEHNVLPKIKDLEKSLYCRVMTATDQEVMSKYGTKPQEILVLYKRHNFTLDLGSVSMEKYAPGEDQLQKRMNELSNMWAELGPWCGRLACKLFIEEVKGELERSEPESRAEVAEYLSRLRTLYSKLEGSIEPHIDDETELLRYASPKLLKLLQILSYFRPRSQGGGASQVPQEELCGIIFVEQRRTAQVLTKWLSEVAEGLPEYAFLRPQFMVGHGGSLTKGLQEAGMTFSKQYKVLKGFRSHKYNLLVATAVVEEGMDVPRCNLVVRFDRCNNFRSYIQSKGRARARRSFFVLMVCEEVQEDAMIQLATNVSIEKNLMEKCHGRRVPNSVEVDASFLKDELLPAYMPVAKDGAARVTVATAIGLVNRYCGKLPSDMFTTLRPSFTITGSSGRFVCTVYLPMTSPLKEPIRGDIMETKKAAKMAAALKACKRLHEIGELDDNMLPVKRVVDIGSTEDEEEGTAPAGTPKAGTKKRRRYYRKRVCQLFQNARLDSAGSYHLHVLKTQLVHLASEAQNWRKEKLLDPEDTSLWFGILLKEKMPTLPGFPIFTRSGEELVTVVYAGTMDLTAEQCALAETFHLALFDEVLRMEKRKLLHFDVGNSPNRVTVVPVTLDGSCAMIDWSFANMTLNPAKKEKNEKFVFRKHEYENAVVVPHYKFPNYPYNSFYVKTIREDLTPDSEWKEGKGTFREYVEHIHSLEITDPSQPLLEVGFTEKRLNMLTPRYANRKGDTFTKKTGNDRLELRLPEFCDIHPLQAPIWKKVVCLPSILYRLGQLLLVEEMRVGVTESTGVGMVHGVESWPLLDYQCVVPGSLAITENLPKTEEVAFGTLLRDHGNTDVVQMPRISKSFEYQPKLEGNPGPGPGLLLEAMTWAKAGDGFDLERLEVLGDSFLKFVVTIDLFCSQTSAQEGLLTEARARIISNRNLHRLACRLNIGERIASSMFEPHRSWLPPGYVMPEDAEEILLDTAFVCWMLSGNSRKLETVSADELRLAYAKFKSESSAPEYVAGQNDVSGPVPICLTTQLADKGVADSVEAIIGSYLLVCGPIGAIKVMRWLGLKLSQCNLDHAASGAGEPRSSFLGFTPPTTGLVYCGTDSHKELEIQLRRLSPTIKEVESALGYTFRDRSFLLQAVTHASYYKNRLTDCYQRLEFLGDAVIDYLVTRYIYEGPLKFNPGQLTDLRSSLVNNSFFASLIVKYRLHGCLKHCNPGLFSAITRFVEYQSMTGDLNEDEEEENGMDQFGDDGVLDLNKEQRETMDQTDFHKKLYFEETECQEPEEVEVPKALGDLFESLMGAVFLDCGMSLDRVWHVIYRMFGREIECFSKNVPLPPIRELMETFPMAQFSPAELLPSGKVKVELNVKGKSFSAIAKSKKVAKSALAKKCLRAVKKSNNP
ncbi:endoribonuclease Dicer-like isoform X2 [Ornithodoros turicata]